MEDQKSKNNVGSEISNDDGYVNIHFLIDGRKEIACFRPDQITDAEIKELFRSAAEAGPLDIVKLRKGAKVLNISPLLPENEAEDPYVLQVVCTHPVSSGIIEASLLHALERRITTLESELYDYKKAMISAPSIALQELKQQVDILKKKLETTEHLSWLGFHKQIPDPISSEACRRLQYRRKSDSIKRRIREKFLNICDIDVSSSVREWLRSPTFDARQWDDDELLLMLQTMFVELELPQKFNIPLSTLRNFIYEVYNNYNEVPFHNFRHCFCVAQMMYTIVWAVDLITKIGDLEVLILIVSCICHDLDHPGYNNIYQINARTELALRYNDISPLENHHCSVAFRILEAPECNILASLDLANYRIVREGIIRCILATDMARHNEILGQFTDAVPDFDYSSKLHVNLLSMVLIKVADISNEARPMDVAEPWLDNLLQEFFKQSDAEKLEGLPVTPFMDRDKVTKPSSQCSFIGFVLLPLFEILGELFPELQELIIEPVRYALEYYRRLNEAAKDERHHRKSIIDIDDHLLSNPSSSGINEQHQIQQSSNQPQSNSPLSKSSGADSVVKSVSSPSTGLKHSFATVHSQSRLFADDVDPIINNITTEESTDLESSDPETATEVEISEKTLKFKISTSGNCSTSIGGRKSYPNSRKGSREKSSLDYYNHDSSKVMCEHEREKRYNRDENFSSNISSPISARSNDMDSRFLEEFEKNVHRHNELAFIKNNSKFEENGNHEVDTTQQMHENRISKQEASMNSSRFKIKTIKSSEIGKDIVRCCCDERLNLNNHKSFLSRLRNLTDRFSMSFDSKEIPIAKAGKHTTIKLSNKNGTIDNSTESNESVHSTNIINVCKKCNLSKRQINKDLKESVATSSMIDYLPNNSDKARSLTLPKVRRTQDNKNKSWRTVFAKEKRPSISLETLQAENTILEMGTSTASNHRRNLSNPERKSYSSTTKSRISQTQNLNHTINFKEIDTRPSMPKIFVDPVNGSSSSAVEDIDKVEIRRSSASMEDISKITKQTEVGLLSSLEQKSDEYQQHSGSLDSVLSKNPLCGRKSVVVYTAKLFPQSQSKKPLPGIFSRLKSSMSTDSPTNVNQSSNNSESVHEQQSAGWISSIAATFRSRRHGELTVQTQIEQRSVHQSVKSVSREEVK